jgi:hypothetical protein
MTEHSINFHHRVQFNDTGILAKKPGHAVCVIREAIEIEHHPDNLNTKEGFSLSKS